MSMSKMKLPVLLLSVLILFSVLPAHAAEVVPPEEITESRYVYDVQAAKIGNFDIPVSFGRSSFLKPVKVVIYHGPDMVIGEVPVKRLDEVSEGDVLVRLEPDQDPLDTEEKKRALQRAEESFERGCRDYERRLRRDQEALDKITDPGQQTLGILQHELLEAEYDKYLLENTRILEKQRLEAEALEQTAEILSPAAGTVNHVVKAGGILKDGDEVAEIFGPYRSTLLVSQKQEERIGRVHFGSGVSCGSEEGVTEGFVSASSFIPEMSNSEDSGAWSVVVLEPDAEVRRRIAEGTSPGNLFDSMTYRERVLENVLHVPSSAVSFETQRGGKEVFYVTVQSEDGRINRRNVQVLNEIADETWIISGLEEGEQVIVRERSY